jgi:hypothetical protein
LPNAELIVLDWQHPAYRFRPADQALTWRAEWRVPVYPDGDYYAFLTNDFTEGTFGHPWENTLCVIGERLGASLGRSLETWLPIKRRRHRLTSGRKHAHPLSGRRPTMAAVGPLPDHPLVVRFTTCVLPQ